MIYTPINITRGRKIAAALTSAVRNRAPFQDALRTLLPPPGRRLYRWLLSMPFVSGLFGFVVMGVTRFEKRVAGTAVILSGGQPLGEALEDQCQRYLTQAYIAGIKTAEDNHQLETVLPILEQSLLKDTVRPNSGRIDIFYSLLMLPALIIFNGIRLFISPRLEDMLREEGGWGSIGKTSMPFTWKIMHYLGTIQDQLLMWLAVLVVLAILLFVISTLAKVTALLIVKLLGKNAPAYHAGNNRRLAIERLLYTCTFGWRIRRLQDYATALQVTQVALICGLTIHEATRLAGESCKTQWLRRRLANCLESLDNGDPWEIAWKTAVRLDPMSTWLLNNGAVREQPCDAFAMSATHYLNRCNGLAKFRNRCLTAGAFLFTASTCLLCSLYVFQSLDILLDGHVFN